MHRIAPIVALTLLAACSGSSTPAPVPALPGAHGLRPATAPDVLLLSVSGRTLSSDLFCPPDCNVAYLGDPGDAAEAVVDALTQHGLVVAHIPYVAALWNYDDDADGSYDDRLGFLQLVADLEWFHETYVAGSAEPPRVILLAHSHGCVWAHLACSVLPDVPIDVLVSLDGVCTQWTGDNEEDIQEYYAAYGNAFPYDIAQPCGRWTVPGADLPFDTEDIVFANVAANLEVQSNGDTPIAQDGRTNHRLDGSATGIQTLVSSLDDHSAVHDPGGQSIPWVLDRLAELGY